MTKSQIPNSKRIFARASFVPGSPRKIRLVADAVRKLPAVAAIAVLKALPQRAAKTLLKVYQQALGNAKSSLALSPADLIVDSLQVHEGPRMPRRDAHAHGARFDSGTKHKRLTHIRLILTTKKEAHGAKS